MAIKREDSKGPNFSNRPLARRLWIERVGAIGLAVLLLGGYSLLFPQEAARSVSLEGISVFLSVFVLDRLNYLRVRLSLQEQLVRDARSRSNSRAIDAVETLGRERWLRKSDPAQSQLLRGANLRKARLDDADFEDASLAETDFTDSSLRNVMFKAADLRKARFLFADLRGANLSESDLSGANLESANLQNANLQQAVFDENTILPDNTVWYPGMNLARYTNPHNPDYYNPCDSRKIPWYCDK